LRGDLVPIFSLGAEDFSIGGEGARWQDGVPRHAVILAWDRTKAPNIPCAGATRIGHIDAGRHGQRPLFECPDDAPDTEANTLNIHRGHLLTTLESADSLAEISVHGFGQDKAELVADIASGIQFRAPHD
jgi:hypothetical protein